MEKRESKNIEKISKESENEKSVEDYTDAEWLSVIRKTVNESNTDSYGFSLLSKDELEKEVKETFNSTNLARLKMKKEGLNQLYEKVKNQNFYERLEIKTNATEDEIRKAFRKMAILFHPDTKPDELKNKYGNILSLYAEAKSTLTNKNERAKYDGEM